MKISYIEHGSSLESFGNNEGFLLIPGGLKLYLRRILRYYDTSRGGIQHQILDTQEPYGSELL